MRLHADQSGIVQAVVRTFEFENFVASGGGTGEAAGVHGGFGAAVAKAHHLYGEALTNFFRELPFHVVRHAKHRAGGKTPRNSLHDGRMTVSGHQRANTEVLVEVLVTIEIAEMRTLLFLPKDWLLIVSEVLARHAGRNPFQIPL